MQAVVIEALDSARIVEVDTPTSDINEVHIQVAAAGVETILV